MKNYKQKYYKREIKSAKEWIFLSLVTLLMCLIFVIIPYLGSDTNNFAKWLALQSKEVHTSRWLFFLVFSPLIFVAAVIYLVYGISKYFHLKHQLKLEK